MNNVKFCMVVALAATAIAVGAVVRQERDRRRFNSLVDSYTNLIAQLNAHEISMDGRVQFVESLQMIMLTNRSAPTEIDKLAAAVDRQTMQQSHDAFMRRTEPTRYP